MAKTGKKKDVVTLGENRGRSKVWAAAPAPTKGSSAVAKESAAATATTANTVPPAGASAGASAVESPVVVMEPEVPLPSARRPATEALAALVAAQAAVLVLHKEDPTRSTESAIPEIRRIRHDLSERYRSRLLGESGG